MNVDINSDVSPLSPAHSTSISTSLKEDISEADNPQHAYMNINPGQENLSECSNLASLRVTTLPLTPTDFDDSSRHCYANLEPKDIENLRIKISTTVLSNSENTNLLPPTTPPIEAIREVNYAVLDLDKNIISATASPDGANVIPSPPDSPNKPQKGYATIDFNKTAALSHSVNPNVVNDNEGSRKTRHNSTINDLATPPRLSSSISE